MYGKKAEKEALIKGKMLYDKCKYNNFLIKMREKKTAAQRNRKEKMKFHKN